MRKRPIRNSDHISLVCHASQLTTTLSVHVIIVKLYNTILSIGNFLDNDDYEYWWTNYRAKHSQGRGRYDFLHQFFDKRSLTQVVQKLALGGKAIFKSNPERAVEILEHM